MNNLCRYRETIGMTQTALGLCVGVTRQRMCDYEHDRYRPGYDRMLELAEAVGVHVDEIWPRKGVDDG